MLSPLGNWVTVIIKSVGFDAIMGRPITESIEVVPNYSRADIDGISVFLVVLTGLLSSMA